VAFDEKAYFQEKPENRPAKYPCPRCKRVNEYSIRWMRRTKRKDRQPQGEDRAKFEKLRDHLLRLDDEVTCKTCGKKFEVPSHSSMMFLDQLEGLPKDDQDADQLESEQPPAAPIDRATLPARFTRPTKGWRG
jgi:hypothetical protein